MSQGVAAQRPVPVPSDRRTAAPGPPPFATNDPNKARATTQQFGRAAPPRGRGRGGPPPPPASRGGLAPPVATGGPPQVPPKPNQFRPESTLSPPSSPTPLSISPPSPPPPTATRSPPPPPPEIHSPILKTSSSADSLASPSSYSSAPPSSSPTPSFSSSPSPSPSSPAERQQPAQSSPSPSPSSSSSPSPSSTGTSGMTKSEIEAQRASRIMVGNTVVPLMKIPWDPDTTRRDCAQCNQPFTFFRRRHHCRSCGHLFCNECTKQRAPVLKWKITRRVRVCGACFDEITGTTQPRQSRGRSQTTSSLPALSKSVSESNITSNNTNNFRSPPFRTRTPSPPRPASPPIPTPSSPPSPPNTSTSSAPQASISPRSLLTSPSAPAGSLQQYQQPSASPVPLVSPSLDNSTSPLRSTPASPPRGGGSFLSGLVGSYIRIAFTFEPESAVELAVRAGDSVLLISTDDDGTWIEGRYHDGRQGWFPSSYASLA